MRTVVLLLAPALLLSSCAVTFVAPYDEVFDRQVSEFHQKTATFLARMNRTHGSYDANQTFYAEAEATIEVLRTRASLYNEAKNKGTLTEIDLLEKDLKDVEKMHRAGPLVEEAYQAARNLLWVPFRALLQIELHKKHSAAVSAPN
jgi:PBP1b-binding outer membrane lipoprotein LpoB